MLVLMLITEKDLKRAATPIGIVDLALASTKTVV